MDKTLLMSVAVLLLVFLLSDRVDGAVRRAVRRAANRRVNNNNGATRDTNLKCFSCDSTNDERCGEKGTNFTVPSKEAVECTGSARCRTVIQEIDGETAYKRDCVYDVDVSNECHLEDLIDSESNVTICYCQKDHCNSATTWTFSVMTCAAVLLTALLGISCH